MPAAVLPNTSFTSSRPSSSTFCFFSRCKSASVVGRYHSTPPAAKCNARDGMQGGGSRSIRTCASSGGTLTLIDGSIWQAPLQGFSLVVVARQGARGFQNGAIAGAAAEIAAVDVLHLTLGRLRMLLQESVRVHDEARRAVAALRAVVGRNADTAPGPGLRVRCQCPRWW